MLLTYLAMVEGQNEHGSIRNRSLQKLLMARFVWNANPHFLREFKGESLDSECSWRKVMCSNGEISKIRIFDIEVGNLSIAYLPPKVQFFELSNCGFASTFETSLFPRGSQVIFFLAKQNSRHSGSYAITAKARASQPQRKFYCWSNFTDTPSENV